MMVAVALVGLAAGSCRLVRRTILHLAIAEWHARSAAEYRRAAAEGRMISGFCSWSYEIPLPPEALAQYPTMAAYHVRLSSRHIRFAWYPWLSDEPDPPRPK